ncbi:MAG TPA: tetratricopeptide repeat protein [Pyrinomonadaceae bacterium]|nr:tetratricopeptide repeat protein [Pyrinomonadaceae bacterium]
MTTSRIEIFKQMIEADPANTSILFGLAKEYEKTGATEEMIETLNRYLAASDDQGNAYGMLARGYEKTGRRDEARTAYERGIEVATNHGHPGMAEEYREVLSSEYEA